jgi:transketolase
MALAARLRGRDNRVYILCGDGEIQEGQAWEAAMFANKYRLSNVTAFVDRNFLQTDGNSEQVMPLEPLAAKWAAFGWRVEEIEGHDFEAILGAVERSKRCTDAPSMIIARTVKGKGVPFMENDNHWHGSPPSREQYERAMEELHG